MFTFGKEGRHWTGAPWTYQDQRAFEEQILSRCQNNPEGAVAYIDRVIDRQLNKAGGLLTFNSVLIAALNLLGDGAFLTNVGSLTAIVSCLPLLFMMYVIWAPAGQYATAEKDFRRGCKLSYYRARLLSLSLAASLVATTIALIIVWHKLN